MQVTISSNEKFISIHIDPGNDKSLSWEELQTIKNKVGCSNLDFIEVYPKELEVVNKANIRHLIHIRGWQCPYLADLEVESTINIYQL